MLTHVGNAVHGESRAAAVQYCSSTVSSHDAAQGDATASKLDTNSKKYYLEQYCRADEACGNAARRTAVSKVVESISSPTYCPYLRV